MTKSSLNKRYWYDFTVRMRLLANIVTTSLPQNSKSAYEQTKIKPPSEMAY